MRSSVGMMTFPIYGKIKNVPNHHFAILRSACLLSLGSEALVTLFPPLWAKLPSCLFERPTAVSSGNWLHGYTEHPYVQATTRPSPEWQRCSRATKLMGQMFSQHLIWAGIGRSLPWHPPASPALWSFDETIVLDCERDVIQLTGKAWLLRPPKCCSPSKGLDCPSKVESQHTAEWMRPKSLNPQSPLSVGRKTTGLLEQRDLAQTLLLNLARAVLAIHKGQSPSQTSLSAWAPTPELLPPHLHSV